MWGPTGEAGVGWAGVGRVDGWLGQGLALIFWRSFSGLDAALARAVCPL